HFETLHPVGIDMGLSRVARVWQRLCNHYSINQLATKKVITVSGTNGKGSTCQMLFLLLQEKNNRIGVYTSPHIHHFSERVQINGLSVTDEQLIQAFTAIETLRREISLSYFEATTLVGLLIFAWEKVDYAILEVGLGGRLDAINIIDADATILTSVGLDHANFLGTDLSQIAVEKAGIFRTDKPAIYGEQTVYQSVINYNKTYKLPKKLNDWGKHQLQNATSVVILLAQLNLLPNDYQSRLEQFSLAGRLQVIGHNPKIIVDVAHNTDAAIALADYIRSQHHNGKIFAVIGMLKDKDHKAVLSVFDGLFDHIYFGGTLGERGFDSKELQTIYQQVSNTDNHIDSSSYPTLTEALNQAKTDASNTDVIYAFGSFLVV
ncbi:MAG: bifunctional folylpolyglutamate synthase/dihydrofolate synthase, partial [Thiotrichales bacterium]